MAINLLIYLRIHRIHRILKRRCLGRDPNIVLTFQRSRDIAQQTLHLSPAQNNSVALRSIDNSIPVHT